MQKFSKGGQTFTSVPYVQRMVSPSVACWSVSLLTINLLYTSDLELIWLGPHYFIIKSASIPWRCIWRVITVRYFCHALFESIVTPTTWSIKFQLPDRNIHPSGRHKLLLSLLVDKHNGISVNRNHTKVEPLCNRSSHVNRLLSS